ncbi:MAG TPA: hypothetical protein VE999_06140 [Gemmataceae bacterium]|jgi:hypothetical protein|nr:hypothetical protein [Gemmataceae bacterium]
MAKGETFEQAISRPPGKSDYPNSAARCRKLDINAKLIYQRMKRDGMTSKEAVSIPVGQN